MKNKIALKLASYFSAVLLLFAIIIGAVFVTLFRTQTFKNHMSDMEARSVSIAAALSDYMGNSGPAGGIMGGMNGYGAYLRFVDDIAMADVWIVDENLRLITSSPMSGTDHNYADLPEDAEKVVKEVFEGQTTFSKGFSSVINSPTLTVGTPIEVNGQIIGAVLLHSPVEGIDDAMMRGIGILAISLLSALLLSSILSVILALLFVKPLNKMKSSALLLAGGDYCAKTGVSQDDEIGQLAGAIDSLSEKLQAAKHESDKLDKLRRDFVTNISHELKTPVTVIRGSLEALYDEVVIEPEQVKKYHQEMLSEVIILQRLVNDLLDLSKLQNTDFAIEMQPLNLCDILSDAARSAAHLAKEKHIEIIQNYDTNFQTIVGDYGRLRQMFLITLDNAVKFSPNERVITITLKNGVVTISDKGHGIKSEDLPYIFDRFYRARTEDNKTGSGLGLAIAKQIADRHGIQVSVYSELNEGTAFEFSFINAI